MGSPHSPNREETELLKREGWSTAKEMIIVFLLLKSNARLHNCTTWRIFVI